MPFQPVLEHQPLQSSIFKVVVFDVVSRQRIRHSSITVRDRRRQRILIHHILKLLLPIFDAHQRCRRQLQTQRRLQQIERRRSRRRSIVMRLVHDHHQIVKPRQLIDERLVDLVRLPHLCALAVELVDVVDVNVHALVVEPPLLVIVLAVRRGIIAETPRALEHIFIVRRIAQLPTELFVDRDVGGDHKKILHAEIAVEVNDECTRKPRFAHARRQRERQRHELAFEILARPRDRIDFSQCRLQIVRTTEGFFRADFRQERVEQTERFPLRRPQRHAIGNVIGGVLLERRAQKFFLQRPSPPPVEQTIRQSTQFDPIV